MGRKRESRTAAGETSRVEDDEIERGGGQSRKGRYPETSDTVYHGGGDHSEGEGQGPDE